MPYKYRFSGPDGSHFVCNLSCSSCEAETKKGRQCRRRVCIGLPFCPIHLLYDKHLRIASSTIQNAGKGLFATLPPNQVRNGHDDIIFRKGDIIIEYHGEMVSSRELDLRYGDYTAPYGIQHRGDRFEDAACYRGIGALANHKPKRLANAEYIAGLINRQPKVKLRAIKNIRNGDEITCSYGSDYRFDEGTRSITTSVK